MTSFKIRKPGNQGSLNVFFCLGLTLILGLVSTGCGAPNTLPPSSTEDEVPPAPTQTEVLPTPTQTEIGIDELIQKAIDHLAQTENIQPAGIELVSVKANQFPDASLGVPEPDQVYAQVLTPGYIIQLRIGEDKYIYHASTERVVLAETQLSAEAYQVVEIPELNLSFEVPGGWQQLGEDVKWVPESGSDLALGFNSVVLQPPQEPEAALLPSPGQTLSSSEIESGLGNGRSFTLEVFGASPGVGTQAPVVSVETHLIILLNQGADRIGLSLYSSAPTLEELAELETHLDHMLESLQLIDDASG